MMKIALVLITIIINCLHITAQISETIFIKNSNVNDARSNFGMFFYGEDIAFYTSPKERGQIKDSNFDFYYGFIDEYGDITDSKRLDRKINSRYDEIDLAFTNDLKTVYFTRRKRSFGSKKGRLELYKADVESPGSWSNITKLPFNQSKVSISSPCLSADNKTLYFTSNMKGTLGGTDIFKVAIFGNNIFGNPINLGPNINTPANETTPFILDNTLYFSSNGRGGLGGLDIFSIELKANSLAVNLGDTINSKNDDYNFILNNSVGSFTSNRENGKGSNDIYFFQKLAPKVIGKEDVKVKKEIIEVKDSLPKIEEVSNMEIDSVSEYVKCQTELDKIENVFFDLDESYIRTDAASELDKVINIMRRCPKVVLIASSHTDSRAPYDYNLTLSQARANAILSYILYNSNFSDSRITSIGYGEARLKNRCADNVKCTEFEHQINRRTEFEISNY